MASLFEEMGGTYTLGADGMYYPNLELPEEETPRFGKYGKLRHTYLREHKKAFYTILLFDGKLVAHLNEIDDSAHRRMDLLTKQMANAQGITEQLKARDQMAWVGAMNNIRNAAGEKSLVNRYLHNQVGESNFSLIPLPFYNMHNYISTLIKCIKSKIPFQLEQKKIAQIANT